MPILQTIEMNCQLLDISNLCLIIFQILQILQALYFFNFFSLLLLFCDIHFPVWFPFDVLN